jgi:hypothetical protein
MAASGLRQKRSLLRQLAKDALLPFAIGNDDLDAFLSTRCQRQPGSPFTGLPPAATTRAGAAANCDDNTAPTNNSTAQTH